MALPVFTPEGKLKFISDRETKAQRGIREVTSSGVGAPSDGMIEFSLRVGEGNREQFWMTCEEARIFCTMLDDMLILHDELGVRNSYPGS